MGCVRSVCEEWGETFACTLTETVVEAVEVCGKCEVVFEEDIDGDKDDWFSATPNRFYFFEVCSAILCTLGMHNLHLSIQPPPHPIVLYRHSVPLFCPLQAYNSHTRQFEDPPYQARGTTNRGKVNKCKTVTSDVHVFE